MEHSSAAAVTVSNTVDTEVIDHFADCKNYSKNSGLEFWVTNANKYPLLTHLPSTCCQLLRLRHMWNVCSQSVESRQQAKEENRAENEPEIVCMILVSRFLFSRLFVNISGSSAL